MPLAPENYQALDDALNRLASESMLATPGRDEGLIPSYSLLGELADLCAAEPALHEAIRGTHGVLDKLLDAAQPFDAAVIAQLSKLIEWLPKAIEAAKAGHSPEVFSADAAPAPAPAETASDAGEHAAVDVLLELNMAENQELLGEFYSEALDHLQQIEAALLVLDQQPDDPEALNSMFRSFHTFKGNAGFLGLVPMQSLAHEVESLLDLARNGELRLSQVIITEILKSRDALQALTQQVAVALEKGVIPKEIIPVLQSKYFFYMWDEKRSEVRWMTSFDTREEDILNFTALIKSLV